MADKKSRSRSVTPGAKGDITVGSGATSSAIVTVGSNGQVLTADSTQTAGVKWAAVGTNWTLRLTNIGNGFNQIAYNGSNLYVAAGVGGILYTSPDGITWTSRTSGFGASQIYDVAYGNGLWVAVGASGLISTSTDGITWTARTSNMSTNNIQTVTYANSLWVAVGAGGGTTNTGGITYSSDGITWTRKSQSLTVGSQYCSVVWNGTNWIVGATSSTNNYLYASTPSGTWTAGATGTANAIFGIWWDGTRNITAEASGTGVQIKFRYSTSATLGTTTAYVGIPELDLTNLNNAAGPAKLYNGNIYTNGIFVQYFTPISSTKPQASFPIFSPLTYMTGLNPYWYADGAAIYVNSSGYILASANGGIYTSF